MAVAEARAVWQRTANRCFVQEDAKRAPKLACCPSTSSSAKPVDTPPASPEDAQDYLIPGFAPLNRNPSYNNLPVESRWWLQLPPNYGYQRVLANEQSGTSAAEKETLQVSNVSRARLPVEGGGPCIAKDCHEIFKAEVGKGSYKLMEMDYARFADSKEITELGSGPGFSWIRSEKSEPWWRKTDRDDLASFVAQRSRDLIENCDLPQPQNKNVKWIPHGCVYNLDQDGIFTSYRDQKPQIVGCPNRTIHNRSTATSGSANRKCWPSIELHTHCGTSKAISEGTIHKGFMDMPEADPCKAQLLEALRHSQTRAREAEKAAKEAYAEKEHIVKLLFRQASHLFAHKQWFHLLQLENLYFEIKNSKNQPVPSPFSVSLPSPVPCKTRKVQKNRQKPPKKRAKRDLPRRNYDISKYAVVFALGLSLVGAGLLLGWTVGWMLHASL